MDVNNIIFMDLPDSPLKLQVLPIFEQLFFELVHHAPHQPDLVAIEDCFKAFKMMGGNEILPIIDAWHCPLYGHTLSCYIKLLYPSAQVSAGLPIRAFTPKPINTETNPPSLKLSLSNTTDTSTSMTTRHSTTLSTPPSLSPLPALQLPQSSSLPSEPSQEPINSPLEAPRDSMLALFAKYGCKCEHQDCDHITVLHSFLTSVQFSRIVSRGVSPEAFNLISEKYLNHFDSVDDISPLMIAMNNPYTTKLIEHLIYTRKCRLNIPSKNGKYPLQQAIQRGPQSHDYMKMVKLLIEHKADLFYPSVNQALQPLSLAINVRSDPMGELLVKSGYPANTPYSYGTPMLTAAISQHMTTTAMALLQAKADISAKPGQDGNTILHSAALFNNPDVVEKLLEMKIPVDTPNTTGQTPLEVLMQQGVHGNVIRTLIMNKANPNVTHKNVPLLCQALFRHHYDQIRSLLVASYGLSVIDQSVKFPSTPTQDMNTFFAPTPLPSPSNPSPPPPLNRAASTPKIPASEPPAKKSTWFRSLFGGNTPAKTTNDIKSPSPTPQKKNRSTMTSVQLFPDCNLPCVRTIYQGTPFLYACHSAPQDIVEIMIKYFSANLFTRNDHKFTAIHIAIQRDRDIIKQQKLHFEAQNEWIQGRIGPSLNTLINQQQQQLQQQQQQQTPSQHHFHHPVISPSLLSETSSCHSRISSHQNGRDSGSNLMRTSFNSTNSGNIDPPPAATKSPTRTRTGTFGSFHSVNAQPYSPRNFHRIPITPSQHGGDPDHDRYEANRLTIAKSFHISSTRFNPLEFTSTFRLTKTSLDLIPLYDTQTESYTSVHSPPASPLSLMRSLSATSTHSLRDSATPQGTKVDQLQLSLSNSTSSNKSGPYSAANHPRSHHHHLRNSEKPPTLPQSKAPSSSTSKIATTTTTHTYDDIDVLTPMPEADSEDELPLDTTPTDDQLFGSPILPSPQGSEFTPSLPTKTPVMYDFKGAVIPTKQLREQLGEGEFEVKWDEWETEDEDVVFLIRLLATVQNSFIHRDDEDQFELV